MKHDCYLFTTNTTYSRHLFPLDKQAFCFLEIGAGLLGFDKECRCAND